MRTRGYAEFSPEWDHGGFGGGLIVTVTFVVTPAPDHPSVMLLNVLSDIPVPDEPI
jgi:hypothetical protein